MFSDRSILYFDCELFVGWRVGGDVRAFEDIMARRGFEKGKMREVEHKMCLLANRSRTIRYEPQ